MVATAKLRIVMSSASRRVMGVSRLSKGVISTCAFNESWNLNNVSFQRD